MDIEKILCLIEEEKINWSQHILERMHKRQILIDDILNVVKNGEIIEKYPKDTPYPSCLILGFTELQKPLHVVCAVGDNRLSMITAYYPSMEEWEDDFKTRR